ADAIYWPINVDFVRRHILLNCANVGELLNIVHRGRFFRLLADGGLTREIDAWMRLLLTVQIFLGQRCSGQEILERFPIEREMGVHTRSPVIPQLRSVGGFGVSRSCACPEREVKIVLVSLSYYFAK